MPLSPQQLADLRHDLTALANIKYDHLTNELLDRYATLTEDQMAVGTSFYEASTAAFLAMGNGAGIQQIQERYERQTRHQIKGRYIAIRQSYLEWPKVMTTVGVAVIIAYLILAVLPAHFAKALASLLVLSPAFVLLTACLPYLWQQDSRKRLVWRFIKSHVSITFIYVGLILVMGSSKEGTFSSVVRVGFMLFLTIQNLYLAVCLAQLTRENFYYKPVFQQ